MRLDGKRFENVFIVNTNENLRVASHLPGVTTLASAQSGQPRSHCPHRKIKCDDGKIPFGPKPPAVTRRVPKGLGRGLQTAVISFIPPFST